MAPAIMVAPFAFGFPPAALVGAIVIGALLMGSALHGSGRAPRVSAHLGLDLLVTIGTVGLAVGLALTGELAAAIFFAAAAAFQLLLSANTSYSAAKRAAR